MAIDAGTINSQVRVALDKLKGDVASVQTEMNKIGSMADQTAGQTEKSFTDGFAGMQLAGVAAFAAITMAMKTAIAVAGEYEQSIANVQSVVMGAADVFTQLDNAAKLAGQSTRFTASQAADALYDLASGGLSAAESVGALDGVLMLAGASQANLSSTAAVVVATLNQYNLKAEESVRISNVFSAAIANSMANMEKLTAGMRQAGPVSSALGISLEETVAALAALYDAGFQGEQAGTALRAIMSSLAAETDATTQKLLAQGIAYEDINPAMNSFADVIGTIADAGLTAGDVMSAFGNRAGAQMLTLLNNGKKGLNQYRDAITGTNTAAEMYAIQNDTLSGSLDRLKSAAESAMIEFSEEFTPAMRGALDIVTGMLVAISGLPGPLKIFFAILLTGTPIVLGLAKAFTLLSLAVNSMTGGVGIMVTAMVAGVAGIASFSSAIKNANIKKTEEEFGELAKEVGLTADEMKRLNDVAKEMGLDPTKLKEMADDMGLTTEAVEKLNEVFGHFPMQKQSVLSTIDIWADSFDTTAEVIMRMLLLNDNLMDSDRGMIRSILDTLDLEKKRTDEKQAGIKALEDEKKAERDATSEKQKGIEEAERLRASAYNTYTATLSDIERRVKLGVVTEAEANKEKAKAVDKYIEALLGLNEKYIDIDGQVKNAVDIGKGYTDAVLSQEEADKAAADAITAKAEATEQATASAKAYTEAAEDIGKTEEELLAIQQKREIATINASKADDASKKKAIAAINAYYKALNNQSEIDKKKASDKALADGTDAQEASAESYKQKLEALTQTTLETIEAERKRAVMATLSMGGTTEAIQANVDAINEYYAALKDSTSEKAMIAKTKAMVSQIGSTIGSLAGSLESLFSAIYDNRMAELEEEEQAALRLAGVMEDTALEAAEKELEAAQEASDKSVEAIEKRMNAALAAGDAQSAAALQVQVDEQKALDAKVLGEKKAALERAKIEEDYAKKKKKLEHESAMASWKLQLASSTASVAQMIIQGFLTQPFVPAGIIAGGVATGLGAVQLSAVAAAKPHLATGGIVLPQSGGRDVVLAENGYPELALNAGPSGDAMMAVFARQIVEQMGSQRGGAQSVTINVKVDRKTLTSMVVDDINNGRVRLER